MKKLAIASLKRTALSLRTKQVPVTIINIAKELVVPPADVSRYFTGVTGLAEEVCLDAGKTGPIITGKYLDAVQLLQERGLMITLQRIMVLTCAQKSAVLMWFKRREIEPDALIKQAEFRRNLLVARMRWLRLLYPHRRMTVAWIVDVAGCSRENLYRQMKMYPEFRAGLGFAE